MASTFPTGGKIGEFLYTTFMSEEQPAQEMQKKSKENPNLVKVKFIHRKRVRNGKN